MKTRRSSRIYSGEPSQCDTFQYFLREVNPATITAVRLALAAYTVGVERGFLSRQEAIQRILTVLRFFANAPQREAPDATGYKGFYYHFLDMETGQRVWQSELSTIDTIYFLAGALAAAAYFDRNTPEETEIRTLADAVYRCVKIAIDGFHHLVYVTATALAYSLLKLSFLW